VSFSDCKPDGRWVQIAFRVTATVRWNPLMTERLFSILFSKNFGSWTFNGGSGAAPSDMSAELPTNPALRLPARTIHIHH
jgi:hypothetical protein